MLSIVEIDADERIRRVITFDLDDFEAAFEELDARYLAGEAAAHAHTWSVIAGAYAALNRHELPQTTPDWVSIDHRRGGRVRTRRPDRIRPRRVGPPPNMSTYIEAVHRLNDLGAVVTHVAHGTSQEGFDAEWRVVDTSDSRRRPGQPRRALRRGRPRRGAREVRTAQPPGAVAGKRGKPSVRALSGALCGARLGRHGGPMADDFSTDDRRRVVGSGLRIGREAQIADMRAIADLVITNMTWTS